MQPCGCLEDSWDGEALVVEPAAVVVAVRVHHHERLQKLLHHRRELLVPVHLPQPVELHLNTHGERVAVIRNPKYVQ